MKGDLGQRSIGISYTRYLKKCVTQIYRDLYGDAVLVPKTDGHQHGSRKPTETSLYRVLLQLRKFIPRVTHKH